MSTGDASADSPLELPAAALTVSVRLDLARELTDLIVWHIRAAHGSDVVSLKRDLSTLSLTATTFVSACQGVLFETVILQPPKFVLNGQRVKGPATALRFSRLIARSPHIAGLVKTLVFRFPYAAEYKEGNNNTLIAALSKLDNLTELRLEGSEGKRTWWGEPTMTTLEIFDADYSGAGRTGVQRALLEIMQRETTKTLKLKNVTVPYMELGKIKGVERLELDKSSMMSVKMNSRVPSPEEYVNVTPLYLKHFVYKGSYMINDTFLDPSGPPCIAANCFKPRWDELETLSLPIQDRHLPLPSALPHVIMSTAKHLKSLDMYTLKAFKPGHDEETMEIPHKCPMRSLHPDSRITLTRILFFVEFDLETATIEDLIKDPYHGLLRGGVIKGCVNLEEVSVRVLIGGHRWKLMVRQSFGRQWGALDKVLAPEGQESPYRRLRKVELRVGNKGVFDKYNVRLHRKRFRRMFDVNFDGLKALRDAGKLELYLGIQHKKHMRGGRDEEKGDWEDQEGSDVDDPMEESASEGKEEKGSDSGDEDSDEGDSEDEGESNNAEEEESDGEDYRSMWSGDDSESEEEDYGY